MGDFKMNKFKVGDRVQFRDTARAKSSWQAWFKRSFGFDAVVTVSEIGDWDIYFKESALPFVTHKDNVEFPSGQMQLPFKGV